MASPAGALVSRAYDLIFEAKELGVTHLKSELSATEFAAMRILRQEQILFDREPKK